MCQQKRPNELHARERYVVRPGGSSSRAGRTAIMRVIALIYLFIVIAPILLVKRIVTRKPLYIALLLGILLISVPGAQAAWWDNDWYNCRNITISSSGVGDVDKNSEMILVNITGLTFSNATREVRIVNNYCNNGGSEVPSYVEDYGSDWAEVWFDFDKTAGTDTVYAAYYNNSGATAPDYSATTNFVVNGATDYNISGNDFEYLIDASMGAWSSIKVTTGDNTNLAEDNSLDPIGLYDGEWEFGNTGTVDVTCAKYNEHDIYFMFYCNSTGHDKIIRVFWTGLVEEVMNIDTDVPDRLPVPMACRTGATILHNSTEYTCNGCNAYNPSNLNMNAGILAWYWNYTSTYNDTFGMVYDVSQDSALESNNIYMDEPSVDRAGVDLGLGPGTGDFSANNDITFYYQTGQRETSGCSGNACFYQQYVDLYHGFIDSPPTASIGSEESSPGPDSTPPTIYIQIPTNTSYESGNEETGIHINVNTSEDADWCTWNLDGGENGTMSNYSMVDWAGNTNESLVNNTLYNLHVYCNDTSGNMGFNDSRWFTYAEQDPIVDLDSPADASTDEDGTVTFNCSAYDDQEIWTIYLWHNGTGTWHNNETLLEDEGLPDWNASQTTQTFPDGVTIMWNCRAGDSLDNFAFAPSNYTFNINMPSPPTVDFISPTLSNGSYTDSADYIEVNVSSNNDLGQAILSIDGFNYTMTCFGTYCYLNFTSLGFTSALGLDETAGSGVWTKYASNPVVPGGTGANLAAEGGMFYEDGYVHLMWRDGEDPPEGYSRANSTDGFLPLTTDSDYWNINASADEQDHNVPWMYHCTDPACPYEYYMIHGYKNASGDVRRHRLRVVYSNDFYAPQEEWTYCMEDLLVGEEIPVFSASGLMEEAAIYFNGSGWELMSAFNINGSNSYVSYVSAYRDDPDICGAFTLLNNGDLTVRYDEHPPNMGAGASCLWFQRVGERYILYMSGRHSSDSLWRTMTFNSTNLINWTPRISGVVLDTDQAYDSWQAACPFIVTTTNETYPTLLYYTSTNQSFLRSSISVAYTNYSVNELWGAGIQDIGELEFIVYVQDTSGTWNSTSRTLNFGSSPPDLTPPGITIDAPENTSYTSIPIDLNVTLNESADACLYNLDGGTNYSMSGSGTDWDAEIDPGVSGTFQLFVYCNDSDSNMGLNSSIWFTYQVVEYSESYKSYTFDTARETFSIIFNLTNYETINNVSAVLTWNGTDYSATSTGRSGDILTVNATITVPEATNDVYDVSFNWNYTIYYIDASQESVETDPNTQTVYRLDLDNCTSGNITLYFNLLDEDTDAAVSGDLGIAFTIDSVSGGYDTNKNFSSSMEDSTYFTFCMLPYWPTIYVDAFAQYEATGYSQRTYYLSDAGLSNTSQNITLYLADNATTTFVTMEVLNSLGLPEEDVYINVQRYDIGTDTYETVAILLTDFEGKAYSYLTLNTVWYRFILSQDSTVLETFGPTILTEDEITFQLAAGELGEWFSYYGSVAHNCTWPSNTTTCTVTDTSGLMVSSTLYVKRWASLGYIDVCETSSTSSAATLVCDMGSIDGNIYWYELTAVFGSTETTLESGFIDYRTEDIYSTLGVLAALMLMLTLIFIGAYRWEISLGLCAVSMALSWMMGILVIGYTSVVAAFVVAAVTIYKIRST